MSAWQYTPYSIPLIIVAIGTAVLALFVQRARRTHGARTLALLMSAVAVWSFAYMLQLEGSSFAVKVFWAKFKYFGIVLAPTAWLILALQYSGNVRRLGARNLALLTIMPVATLLLVWTNDSHHLFWADVTLEYLDAHYILYLKEGVSFWLWLSYSYILLLYGMFAMIRASIHSTRLYRRQTVIIILLGSLAPLGGNVLYLARLTPVPHLDLTPFAFAITCLACAWGLFRFRLLGIVPTARNAVIESMDDAVIVLDAEDCILDINPAARSLLRPEASKALGRPIEKIWPYPSDIPKPSRDNPQASLEIALGDGDEQQIYDMRISPQLDTAGNLVSNIVVLRDITEAKRAEKALKESEERYRMLVEEAKDIICTIDLKTGILTSTNDYGAQLLGYKSEDVAGKLNFLELVHPEDHESVMERMRGLAFEKTRVPNFPVRLKRADGAYIHVETNGSVVNADDGPGAFIGVLRDVTEQKRTTEALKESEERYRVLVDNSLTGVCLIQDGKFLFANRRAIEMTGYSREELVGMPLEQVIYPDDRDLVRGIVASRMSGQDLTTQYQVRIVAKNGDVLWIETFGAPLEFQGEPALMVNWIDITERRRAEEALQLTQFTVDHAPDPVYWVAKDARFVYVNEAACRLLGYSREELLSMTVHDIDPDFPREIWSSHWNDLRKRRTLTFETNHRAKDGKVFPVEVTANLLEFMGKEYNCAVAHDITNRKEAEQQIRLSEEKYRTLFEESKDCVYITSPEGAFLDVNLAGVELFGYSSREELLKADLGRDIYMNPKDRDAFQEAIARHGFVKDYELLMKKKDGRELNTLVTANAVCKADGSIMAYRGIMRDITAQKKLEQQLLQSQKMESIGTLAGGIAHDFNNILGGILGYASFMKTKMDEGHPFSGYIDTIESGAMRAAELTSQLLAFARGGKYETRPIDLNRIVDETLKLLGRTLDKSIEIDSRLYPELPTVEADAGQMQQVLMNLCVNAGDAMPGGGRMLIETNLETLDKRYAEKHMEAKPCEYVVVTITDNGIGMDKETIHRIFEPFFTTKDEGKGTGLGLSMVYGVVKNHGGFIDVDSEPREGSTFKVFLPVSGKTEVRRSTETDKLAGGNELILVADDEEPMRRLAREILEAYGYRVLLAEDGVEAVEIIRGQNGEIDLVILDMVMPKMGGRETYLRMKETHPLIKVLLSTGYSRDEKAQEILDSGAMGFVQKPYHVDSLLSAVRDVLDASARA